VLEDETYGRTAFITRTAPVDALDECRGPTALGLLLFVDPAVLDHGQRLAVSCALLRARPAWYFAGFVFGTQRVVTADRERVLLPRANWCTWEKEG
jgi:hypothetical protein